MLVGSRRRDNDQREGWLNLINVSGWLVACLHVYSCNDVLRRFYQRQLRRSSPDNNLLNTLLLRYLITCLLHSRVIIELVDVSPDFLVVVSPDVLFSRLVLFFID